MNWKALFIAGAAPLLAAAPLPANDNPQEVERALKDTGARIHRLRQQMDALQANGSPAEQKIANQPATAAPKESAPAPKAVPVQDSAPDGSSLTLYTVQKGDNLWSLSRRFDVDSATLKSLNGLEGESPIIRIGQKLKIPAGGKNAPAQAAASPAPAAAAAVPEPAPAPPEPPAPKQEAAAPAPAEDAAPATSGPRRYEVQPGDTLLALAFRYDTTRAELQLLNGLDSPDQLQPGQILLLPSGSGVKTPPGPAAEPEPEVAAESVDPAPSDTAAVSAAGPAAISAAPQPAPQAPAAAPAETPATAIASEEEIPVFRPYLSEPDPEGASDRVDPARIPSESILPDRDVPSHGLHVVQPRETLPDIVNRYAVSLAQLLELNRHLEPGQRLVRGELIRVAQHNPLILPEDQTVAPAASTASVDP